jgi:hypothetical protein
MEAILRVFSEDRRALPQAALVGGQIVAIPLALPMELPISRPERIRRILRNSAAGDALRVHERSQIAPYRGFRAILRNGLKKEG